MYRSPQGEAFTALILETFRLNGALLSAGNQLTKPHGLTSARWQVMGAIQLAGQTLTVAQIARRMGLTRQAVQQIINILKQQDLVGLQVNLDHKRAPLFSISTKGEKVMAAIEKAQITWVNELSENLSEQQLNQALGTLRSARIRIEDT